MVHANEMTGAKHNYNAYVNTMNNTLMYGHYKGNDNYCTPLVTRERWDTWQQLQKKNVRARKTTREYIFTQLCVCSECDTRMAGHWSGSHREYYYYRCNKHRIDNQCANNKSIPELTIEEYLLATIKPEIERYIAEYEIVQKQPVKKPSNADKLKKLEKRLERVNYQYEEDRISQDEYDRKYKALIEEMNALLVADDFPFSPFITTFVTLSDTRGVNIVAVCPNLVLVDTLMQGGAYYQDTDDPDKQDMMAKALESSAAYALIDL
jgi:hypothetical protein